MTSPTSQPFPTNTANVPPIVPTSTSGPASTSRGDTGQTTLPRDARTIHMVLASLGITAYQERVPLQLLDFAYRYTAGILSDAQHLAAEGYVAPAGTGTSGKGRGAAVADEGGVGLAALRLATANRNGYQFAGALPKETLLEMAAERNKVRLPEVQKEVYFGVRLPHERFVMTGTSWDMLGEWDSEDDKQEEIIRPQDGARHDRYEANNEKKIVVNGDIGSPRGGPSTEEDEDMAEDDGFDQVFGRESQGEGMDEE